MTRLLLVATALAAVVGVNKRLTLIDDGADVCGC